MDPGQQPSAKAFALLSEIATIPECVTLEQFEGALVRAVVEAGYDSAVFLTISGEVGASANLDPESFDTTTFDHPTAIEEINRGDGTFVAIPLVGISEGYGSVLIEITGDSPSKTELSQFDRIGSVITDRMARCNRRQKRADDLTTARRAFRKIHSVAIQMVGIDYEEGVYELAIDAAENVFSFDACSIIEIDDGNVTHAVTSSDVFDRGADELRSETGIAEEAFSQNRTIIVDDVEESPVSYQGGNGSYRSSLAVPIEDVGVFLTVAHEPDAFADRDVGLAELLMSYVSQSVNRIRYERELERQNERLEEFASVVSHDLRSPLTVASGRLELAKETGDMSEVDAAIDALDRMDALIENVLALARQGRTVGELLPIDVGSVADDAWNSVETKRAQFVGPDSEIVVNADRTRLRQLFENLFRNAVEHGGDDVTVTVGELTDGFYVADDGVGIPADERDHVFERGYTTDESGTGFGLAIVRSIAHAHGWTIEAVQTETGARFEVRGTTSP